MDKIAKIDPKQTAERIKQALVTGFEEASKIWVEYLDAGGDAVECAKELPLDAPALAVLEEVGRGEVDLGVYLLPIHTQRHLRRLPASEQRQILKDGVEVLASDGSSLRVSVGDLTREQASVVFGGSSGIRSLPSQRAYIESKATEKVVVKEMRDKSPVPFEWDTKKKVLRVLPNSTGAEISYRQIQQMLMEAL